MFQCLEIIPSGISGLSGELDSGSHWFEEYNMLRTVAPVAQK